MTGEYPDMEMVRVFGRNPGKITYEIDTIPVMHFNSMFYPSYCYINLGNCNNSRLVEEWAGLIIPTFQGNNSDSGWIYILYNFRVQKVRLPSLLLQIYHFSNSNEHRCSDIHQWLEWSSGWFSRFWLAWLYQLYHQEDRLHWLQFDRWLQMASILNIWYWSQHNLK